MAHLPFASSTILASHIAMTGREAAIKSDLTAYQLPVEDY